MSRYSRLSEERLHKPSHGEDNCKTSDPPQPQHRRVSSASNTRVLVHRQVPRAANDTDSWTTTTTMPEPPEGLIMDESQRETWQAQWAEALKKVQSLGVSAGSQSERWSGVATDLTTSTTTTPAAPARKSLDRWNYYPGPSVARTAADSALAWNHPASKLKGRGSRSVTSWGGTQNNNMKASTTVSPVLKKAISMREGGAHQDAVLQMARAYTDTVCGVPKSLDCDSCGRSLGIIVQGNPGVEVAFCHACRPKAKQKKKNVIMQFCRRMLRLKPSEVIQAS